MFAFFRLIGASSSCSTCTLTASFRATRTAVASRCYSNTHRASWSPETEFGCTLDCVRMSRRSCPPARWSTWPSSASPGGSTSSTSIATSSPNAMSNTALCTSVRRLRGPSRTSGWTVCPRYLFQVGIHHVGLKKMVAPSFVATFMKYYFACSEISAQALFGVTFT